jgi:hypothetical protein|tara:strand:- start:3147 stop:3710 length:564 start_codon:yes stop_codon:yes gene_type:complete
MDIAKLGEYFEAKKYLYEGIKWAEKMLEEGFFDWHEDDTMPSGLPYVFIACKGTDYEDVTKLKDLINLSVAFFKFSMECHKYVKGHDPDMVGDGEGGMECSICLEEYHMKELEIKGIHPLGNAIARMGKDHTYGQVNGHWCTVPEGMEMEMEMETNEFDILELQRVAAGEGDPLGGSHLSEDAHLDT